MSREQEYLRRMKALGYEPSLAQPPPLRTVYRPVDRGLAARLLRMFGQPYDKSAIPKGQPPSELFPGFVPPGPG